MNKQAAVLKKYRIENLDCPKCALKVERHLRGLPYVREAQINFATQTLLIDTDDFKAATKEILGIEHQVVISKFESVLKRTSVKDFLWKSLLHGDLKTILLASAIFLISFSEVITTALPTAYAPLALIVLAYLLLGYPVLRKAVANLRHGQIFDENFLMGLSTLVAFAISAHAEAVSVMLFYRIGCLFQELALSKSRESIKSLLEIRPNKANLLQGNGEIKEISPDEVHIGDKIIVRPGERTPLDGSIVSGESWIDSSTLTGESRPIYLKKGDTILAGMIATSGILTILVEKSYEDSSISKIIHLVENAIQKKAPIDRLMTTLARYYTPAVLLLAILVATLPPLLLSGQTFSVWIYRALVMLVISCPCALVISIPLGYFGGLGATSKAGILIKGANILDGLRKVHTVIFDKTGTLTSGEFEITEITPSELFSKDELIKHAATAEYHSQHPLADVIKNAHPHKIDPLSILSHQEFGGLGVKTTTEKNTIVAGNDKILHLENIPHTCREEENTSVHIGVDGIYAGNIEFQDQLREDAKHTLEELCHLGIKRMVMLTGDSRHIAAKTSGRLNIKEFYAGLLPDEKLRHLEEIIASKPKGKLTLYIGDGINDAPVIARADIGASMGNIGSDAAIEVSDLVIMNDSLSKLPLAIRIAHRTHKIILQNIGLAFTVKALFLVLGAYGVASMWEAVFADVGVALLAILNAIRTMRISAHTV
ncbi:MAG: cadmium-translocating P-type ATPase [Oligoflexia bacterium]|nr:cadmium-translocating P-type ATPase [Oligoflexia bacterium]MBF0364895.1 cadmium-translocating P-type ATPase [Oligoflexia bacterium]